MLDRIGSVASEAAPAVDMMGKLSVRALDSVSSSLRCSIVKLTIQLPLPLLIVLFLACLALINYP
jgi:hypothetical protein